MKKHTTHRLSIASIVWLLVVLALVGCSTTRHVPDGEYLLDKVHIETDNKSVPPAMLRTYIQQNPNYRALGFIPFQLGLYNMSGNDTTKSINRWLRKVGDAPVIYDAKAMDASCYHISKVLSNMGYMHASVEADTVAKGKRMAITYRVKTDEPFYVDTLLYDIPHTVIDSIIHSQPSSITRGMLLDRSLLNLERDRIAAMLHREGFYTFNKEYITFSADTVSSSRAVELTMTLRPMPSFDNQGTASYDSYRQYRINKVYVVTDPGVVAIDLAQVDVSHTEPYRGIDIVYGDNRYITPLALAENCFIMPGEMYSSEMVDRTYRAFGRLTYLRNINVRFRVHNELPDDTRLDCYIFLAPGKSQNISAEVEGTNSEGDLGVAAQLTYQHRNIFKGSEIFTAEVRGAYESVSGTIQGLINDSYTEIGGRVGLKVPKFLFPFVPYKTRRKLLATTDFDASVNFQQRPEYTRIIAGAAWRYNWADGAHRHRVDLLDFNYVYLPYYMDGFLEQIAPSNPLLRYSYEDHFIMGIGYNFYTSNLPTNTPLQKTQLSNAYTLRATIESAGNLLYGISNLTGPAPDDGYKMFGIRYSQYVKANLDYSFLHNFSKRHGLAFHAGVGVGVPYGNSSVMPFEKRFYSGGANSVRGWAVRTLGPGSYNGYNTANNFVYQCGDVRLDLSVEYRAKLFWKIESAIFIDAGNIWTINDYETQPGGAFRFDTYYKQIALAYGLGLRLNFDFVVIRADFGMKAYNPADGSVKWAIAAHDFNRDFAWHISIGYPF